MKSSIVTVIPEIVSITGSRCSKVERNIFAVDIVFSRHDTLAVDLPPGMY